MSNLADEAERLSLDELRALQLRRLQWTLQHAYDNVPFSPPGSPRTSRWYSPPRLGWTR